MMTDKLYTSDESDDGDIQTQMQITRIQGPNISNFNFSKLPIGNNERPGYAKSLYDQRSCTREKRDTSPMSVYSISSLRQQHSMNRGAMSFRQSMNNGRFGSSMSVRSFDSNASLRATDIAQALLSEDFCERDMRIIKDAFSKCIKKRFRKRVEKRRHKKMISKPFRRRSGYDSGELGSESSGSSDGGRSVRTCITNFRDNNSSSSCRTARSRYTDFQTTMPMANLYKDCTANFKQHAARSLISSAPKYAQQKMNLQNPSTVVQTQLTSQKERFGNGFLLPSQKFDRSIASSSIPEHFNKQNKTNNFSCGRSNSKNARDHQLESDSESEEIFFANTTARTNITKPNSKRNFNHSDDESNCLPKNKRSKLSSPQKRVEKRPQIRNAPLTDRKTCDFVFAKPQLPLLKKSLKPVQCNEKSKQNDESFQLAKKTVININEAPANEPTTKTSNTIEKSISKSNPPKRNISPEPQPAEQLIAMSSQPLDDVMFSNPQQIQKNLPSNSPQDKDHIDQSESTQFSTTDMSMRPSFIKRKLFTQKADIAENKNASSDSMEENSQQSNMYSMIQKEKNRTRKLVTSQSCLNRDLGDESNLLDLIHKIVPANQMNLTTASRTDIRSNKSTPENFSDKWDVSSAATKEHEESDTYTDEEIFNTNETVNSKAKNTNTAGTQKERPNKIMHKVKPHNTQIKPPEENKSSSTNNGNKLNPVSNIVETEKEKPNNKANILKPPITQVKPPEENQDIHTIRALNCAKSFWHSDMESDDDNVKQCGTMITSTTSKNCYKMNPVPVTSEDLSVINKNCKGVNDVQKHTKVINGESETVVSSPVGNSKQKKPSKDKSLSKSPPQRKQLQNGIAKKPGISEKPAEKENKSGQDSRAVKNTQEKLKGNKNVSSNVNNEELCNTKVANRNREGKFTHEKDKNQIVVNKTLRINVGPKPQSCPKLQSCNIPPKNNAVNDKIKLLTKTLRNREIDLSTTASSGLDITSKDVPKRRGRLRKNEGGSREMDVSTTASSGLDKTSKVVPKRRGQPRKNEGGSREMDVSTTASSGLDKTSKDVPKRRGLPRKNEGGAREMDVSTTASSGLDKTSKVVPKRRGQPRKNEGGTREVDLSTTASSGLDKTSKDVPKRRGQPRKNEGGSREMDVSTTASSGLNKTSKDVPKRRGQPRKNEGGSREIDLSTTASSGLDITLKDTPKRGRPCKNERNMNNVGNKENISNLSDLSFTLQLDKTVMTRGMKSKINSVLSDNRKRPSDVSFSIKTDSKNFNKTSTITRSADISRHLGETVNSGVTRQKRMLIRNY